jgi:U3 small nucleolar RNA-associated protein MPP10
LLVPNPTLSETARAASQYLFSSLRPFSQKSPLDQLFVDGYDAEQIWHQIDLQSQPLLSTLRRRVNQFVKNPEEIAPLKVPSAVAKKVEAKNQQEWEEESDDFDEELDEDEDDFEGLEKEKKKKEEVKERKIQKKEKKRMMMMMKKKKGARRKTKTRRVKKRKVKVVALKINF